MVRRVWCRPAMQYGSSASAKKGSGVVGPNRVQLPQTSPLALSFPLEEREPGIRNFFFVNITLHKRSSAKISSQVAKSAIYFRVYCL